jgi:hypothetical protein
MAYGLGEAIDRWLIHTWEIYPGNKKPWRKIRKKGQKYRKRAKHKVERQRVRLNIEAPTTYGKYHGWEW